MFCEKCGKENDTGVYCVYCGSSLYAESETPYSQQSSSPTVFKNCGERIKGFAGGIFAVLVILNILFVTGTYIALVISISDAEINSILFFPFLFVLILSIYISKALSSILYGFGIIVSAHETKE